MYFPRVIEVSIDIIVMQSPNKPTHNQYVQPGLEVLAATQRRQITKQYLLSTSINKESYLDRYYSSQTLNPKFLNILNMR